MKKGLLILMCLCLACTGAVFAQQDTSANQDVAITSDGYLKAQQSNPASMTTAAKSPYAIVMYANTNTRPAAPVIDSQSVANANMIQCRIIASKTTGILPQAEEVPLFTDIAATSSQDTMIEDTLISI